MSHRLENPTVSACVQETNLLFLIEHRHKEIGREKQQSSTELRRGYSNDGEGMLVELNGSAHDATVILKMRVPICVAEYDIRSAVRAVLIGGVEETAKMRLKA